MQVDPTSLLIHAADEKVDAIRRHLGDVHAEVIDHRQWGAPWKVIEIVRHGLNKAVGHFTCVEVDGYSERTDYCIW